MSDARSSGAPSWVPNSVTAIAGAANLGGEVGSRLLMDARMKGVWQFLASRSVSPSTDYVEGLSGFVRLKTWDIEEDGYSTKDLAYAAMYAFAAVHLSNWLPVWSSAALKSSIKQFEDAACLCRAMINTDHLGSKDPEMARCLSESAAYFERFVAETVRPIKDSEFFVERERQGSEARVRAQMIAHEMQRLFGQYLHGIVATVVSVGLALPEPLEDKDVQGWLRPKGAPNNAVP